MSRDCNKCIHHISGSCSAWKCDMQTLEDYRNKAIDEFAEQLKEKAEEIMKNPDIMLDCKKCTIWKVRDIEEIAEQLKAGD